MSTNRAQSRADSITDTAVNSPARSEITIEPEDENVQVSEKNEKRQAAEAGPHALFASPDSFPLPDAGYHSLGVAFDHLTVLGAGATHKTVEGLEISLLRMWDLPKFIRTLINYKSGPTRELISDFIGLVPPGQTMLVLGRPGSGCSTLRTSSKASQTRTFLTSSCCPVRAIANERSPFVRIDGEVTYGGISAQEASKKFMGEIVFNSEEDIHEPILTVQQTLGVAYSLKKPHSLPTPTKRAAFAKDFTNRILNTFGMPHTANTLVGSETVRGVSGGERKRVSLSEILTIRGLDSAVALRFLEVLKELSRSTGMANIVSIYQTSQVMWETCFDRVMVIYSGQLCFSGRVEDAEEFFIEQGWQKKARQTTPDFLTACTSVTERRMRTDVSHSIPQTPAEMAAYFRASKYYTQLVEEVAEYKAFHAGAPNSNEFRSAVAKTKAPGTGQNNQYKVSFFQQVGVLVKRQVALTKADMATFITRIVSNILQATIIGAIYRWSSWMRRISPVAYALEALLANEFRTRTLTCSATDLVPHGAGYGDIAYQGCTITGSVAGSATVSGIDYIRVKYVIYTIMVLIGSMLLIRDTGSSSSKVFKRGAARIDPNEDLHGEHDIAERVLTRPREETEEEKAHNASKGSVFTFKDVSYTVQVGGADKVLLNHVSGVVKPGELTALMGASGAGKTTLLDNLARRKTTGKIEGDLRVNGSPLDGSFNKRTGFVQQGDIHEPFSTVRECLQFSALLRQPASVSREEKLAYAEEVIHLLELGPIADALVGNPEIGGLGVEERKRLTIGVELAAKPDLLLFLDEPTSGLDSQAAFEIVRFLQKIAKSGLAVLCTIHQPSGDLFEMFDSVVLLAPGGKTVYSGATGHNAHILTDYFASYGVETPPTANPPEHVISTVAPIGGTTVDWPGRWKESQQAAAILAQIDSLAARGNNAVTDDTKHSAFASSFMEQTKELIIRNFRAQWRQGDYNTTKLVLLVFFGMYIGFTFYKLPNTVAGIEALTLSLLTLIQVAAAIMLDIGLNYQAKMVIYVSRERNGIYSWQALVTALNIVEIPILVVGYTLLFLCYVFAERLNGRATVSGLTWCLWMVYAVFTSTCGILLGAVSPSPFAVPFVLSLVWNIWNGLSWSLVPHPIMVQPFHSFFSWISPLRWYLGSLMSNQISPLKVTCAAAELTRFNAPSGQTCGEYAAAFLTTAAGYLANPDDTSNCGYCQMSSGSDYISTLGYSYSHRWRDWGIFIIFVLSNIGAIFIATWVIRIRPLYKS
ncbi:hypothetical protein P7C70_g397, partial [Phenoliferia sp. Uapishka_3]